MTNILEITDGTTTVNLLSRDFGFCLNNWNPAIAQPKRGGIFQSSSLSEGRKLVNIEFENIEDTFNFDIKGSGQPETITYITNLIQLLEQAREYWTGHADKVYIKAKADCEDNPRYALIVNYSWPEIKFPYGETFFSKVSTIASMINVDLGLEHKIWSTSIPGESECAEASAVQVWHYAYEWMQNSATPNNEVAALMEIANGDLFAGARDLGGSGEIWRSTDSAVIWASVASGSPPFAGVGGIGVRAFLEAANGDLYAGADNVVKSLDSGATWAANFTGTITIVEELIQITNGNIFACGINSSTLGNVWRTINNGGAWTSVFTASDGVLWAMIQLANGDLLAAGASVYASTDNGTTWITRGTINVKGQTDEIKDMAILSDGLLYAITENGTLRRSSDNGVTWPTIHTFSLQAGEEGSKLLQISNGDTYYSFGQGASDAYRIFKSPDLGLSIAEDFAGGVTGFAFLPLLQEVLTSRLFAGLFAEIFELDVTSTVNMGRAATCTNEVYFVNHQNISNLTHVKIDDGGVFTDTFPIAAFPQALLPAVPAVNDAVYFGSDTAVNDTGPFDNLVFDIDTPANGTVFTLIAEYYNGAWATLTTTDNTVAVGSNPLTKQRVNSIHWVQPSDWITVAIDGITAYWIRIRLSALTGTLTPPTQQNRDIYIANFPFANIAVAEIAGEIPALLQEKLQNQSDFDGRDATAPDLWENRIICGLRSVANRTNFQVYLNCSDEQNPSGVTVTDTGANATFTTDVTAPTGRNVTYNPAGIEAMATQVTIALGPDIARDFYGKFHAFVRVQRTAGSITDFDVQLQFVSGSGGITFTTVSKQVQTTTAFELLDLGQVQLPVGGTFKTTDLGDVTEIRIEASAASGTPNLIMYDLILMPVDEWSIDSVDFANTDDSIIGRNNDLSKLLDVDSITNPLIDIQSLVRLVGSEQITSVYDPVSPGHAILQANAQQRLWFLAAQTDQTGIQTAWIAPPEIAHSIQLFKNERYLTMKKVE